MSCVRAQTATISNLGRAWSGFNHATPGIVWAYTSCGLGNHGAEDVHNQVNSRVYKGGMVIS